MSESEEADSRARRRSTGGNLLRRRWWRLQTTLIWRSRWVRWSVPFLVGVGAVLFGSFFVPVRKERLETVAVESATWVDRNGRLLAERVGGQGARMTPVELDEVSPHVIDALVAVEDKRFFHHIGLDPVAIARAFKQNVTSLRVVSGGSTITQQLARLLNAERAMLQGKPVPRRSLWQKLREAHLAIRLERTFDKPTILAAFLNRAPFGNSAVGIEAAARRYFGSSAKTLSVAQAAYLIGLPKGPTMYAASPERALARAKQVLEAMERNGMLTSGQVERALDEKLVAKLEGAPSVAMHAVALAEAELRARGATPAGEIGLAIDATLQDRVQELLADEAPRLYKRGGRSAAAVVIDNATGDLLAVVGAAFENNPLWGQYNAATAVRQPGSALKPFLYAAALVKGFTAATLASDVERPFADTWGVFLPENYDQKSHGPVRYREALAQSLNIAAVDTLARTGLDPFADMLAGAGLTTLTRRPGYYGLGLALGSGGVRLVDLTNAYAALARGGLWKPYRLLRGEPPAEDERRILDERVAYVIADILSDGNARAGQFGQGSVLTTPYWTAVKTGTSKGYHDNWTVGFSDQVTIGVWVGDPTGKAMRRVSGVEGAGQMWRRLMNELTNGQSRAPQEPKGLTHMQVCAVSGMKRGPACDGGLDEIFLPGSEPKDTCTWHRHAKVDPTNGLLVPEGCALADAEQKDVTVYPSPYDRWAIETGHGIAERTTDRCPAPPAKYPKAKVTLMSPARTETLHIDVDAPREAQALALEARVDDAAGPMTFLIDEQPFVTVDAPYRAFWPLQQGNHKVQARIEATGTTSAVHEIVVR